VAGEAWPLTRREQEVVGLVAALSNKDIASRLVIS
jgi:ATP/maltotriose-dependent transcriptional regulator MalT